MSALPRLTLLLTALLTLAFFILSPPASRANPARSQPIQQQASSAQAPKTLHFPQRLPDSIRDLHPSQVRVHSASQSIQPPMIPSVTLVHVAQPATTDATPDTTPLSPKPPLSAN